MEGVSKEMSNINTNINWGNIDAFRAAYHECQGETFMFEGQETLKSYAKYVLQYWDMEVKKKEERLRRN